MEAPRTRYAKNGDTHIAFQVFGEGDGDLVLIPGWVSNLELGWEQSGLAQLYERLASFRRVIVLDKRGTGLSDRLPPGVVPTLEQRMDDVRAVMDAVDSDRAALFGQSEGGAMSILFAATYPDRTSALLLYAAWAKGIESEDYPWGISEKEFSAQVDLVERRWGDAALFGLTAPSLEAFPELADAFARFERLSATPATAGALLRAAFDGDVRTALPVITTPTLVLHRRGDKFVPIEHGRFLAEHIRGARMVELDGEDHLPWDIHEQLADEIEIFLTGELAAPATTRVLATVLLTDVVESTRRASELGDHQWARRLDDLDSRTGMEVRRHGGRLVKATGDGHLAIFDGPGRAIACALAIQESAAQIGLPLRAGLHTGEVEVRGDDVGGIAVHVAARVAQCAGANEALVSGAIPPLVLGSGIEFADRGAHALKGVPGAWQLFLVQPSSARSRGVHRARQVDGGVREQSQ